MSRRRTRLVNSSYSVNGGPDVVYAANTIKEEFNEDRYPGSCQCMHGKTELYTGPWASNADVSYDVRNMTLFDTQTSRNFLEGAIAEACQKGIGNLNRRKLYTSNGFGLIQSIAEIDDSIAIFTKKFWQSLSYGSINWGIMPLLGELKELKKHMSRVSKSFEDGQPYADTMRFPFAVASFPTFSNSVSRLEGDVIMSYRGVIRYNFSPTLEYEKFMDRMGIHPDVNVIWDLIPLSFAVDWFLPIGDWLEDNFRSGWVRSVTFDGWLTTRAIWGAEVIGRTDSFQFPGGIRNSGNTFNRSRVVTTLTLDKPPYRKPPEEPRTLAQNAWDTWYLTGRNASVRVITGNTSNKFRKEFGKALSRL